MAENTNTGTPNFFRMTFKEIEKLYHFMQLQRIEEMDSPQGRQRDHHIDIQYHPTGFANVYEARFKEKTYDITDYDSF